MKPQQQHGPIAGHQREHITDRISTSTLLVLLLIPRSATRAIQKHSATAQVAVLDAPHCLLQCVPDEAVRQIREFMRKLS